ncbi:hypothetical protein [Phaeobacter inhibens]|uniref:hypothetical protein n=1 Tax=Phaeobacter inhibens TaxID=221822 RepID=UPI0024B6FA80|nr:hypothetical protein [Phaeobacter inhibens]WHP70247.1 hypothetical protein QMZ01_08775 [Phaeobacter inhibens]
MSLEPSEKVGELGIPSYQRNVLYGELEETFRAERAEALKTIETIAEHFPDLMKDLSEKISQGSDVDLSKYYEAQVIEDWEARVRASGNDVVWDDVFGPLDGADGGTSFGPDEWDRNGDGWPDYDGRGDDGGWDHLDPNGDGDTSDGYGNPDVDAEQNDPNNISPIIVDLNSNGVEVNLSGSVAFDWDGDGFLERTAWVGSSDGFLAIDLNSDGTRGVGDGLIDQPDELSFSVWGEEGQTDLQALRHTFDENRDGVLNSEDIGVWSELRIWKDINQNGLTDAGELHLLQDLNISEISLSYDGGVPFGVLENDISIFGSTLHGLSSLTRNGKTEEGIVGDFSLNYETLGHREIETEFGIRIEFETGEVLQYAHLDGKTFEDVDLDDLALDGAQGDADANLLDAGGHSRLVQISGGDGNDTVIGGNNDDFLAGDAGVDSIRGGNGNDLIFADAGDFGAGGHVAGGVGFDTLRLVGATGINIVLADHELEAAYGADTLGSRLINFQSQKMTAAASAIAERKTFGHLS